MFYTFAYISPRILLLLTSLATAKRIVPTVNELPANACALMYSPLSVDINAPDNGGPVRTLKLAIT